ncbi:MULTISPECIES: FAD-dependent oxidoreductase [unclassified Mucilaginibacter]|uniref:dihydrolipoyl dehydrogenase family protein n=1 Tax=unclassified Mucilaginibacter TaxID=2617802 RepID=UPI002AC9D157|nr:MULTISPECIES: FAD-dependent oxidoreductase [unclassified Mucilaginibacter]MEB0262789.1 FAD-dependent oxidoreductase [Mucilaginibacter sp. 10I4]MEB0278172.1 FAD-dependent oxidoreductase [Mucilaginibacter sp. 10B2]MEB0302054.1 FAD-dependent oxidoreductase [Mucilaginibacter sp. 5C4]WPX23819.1 FAD-dependent oxidoreductase [Mucilaginibacter sp. 5C4]
MAKYEYDIIVIGAGSGGLTVGLFMNQAGFRVLMISTSDLDIGGDCLNDGCVPSKALIRVAKIVHQAREAANVGLQVSGNADIKKVISYINEKRSFIRTHENAQWLNDRGIAVALGNAHFSGKNEVTVNDKTYTARKIVIATGSKPRLLKVEGVEKVRYFDNESVFHLDALPKKILFVGGGPIGIEIAQALHRLGARVTLIHKGSEILEHDDPAVTTILQEQLEKEGIEFLLNARIDRFISATEAIVDNCNGKKIAIDFDAIFVAIGRELVLEHLTLSRADIQVTENKIIVDPYLRTTNKNVFVCGDIAGDLQFSHAAEFHGRIILNNLFSPFKKKLDNQYMSWVTFTDPELATFGLNDKQLKERKIAYRRLEKDFTDDDRAVVDSYQYAKLVLLVSKGGVFRKQKILGGTMIAPNAGELIQELILANTARLSVKAIFNKVYPYPVASRINQSLVADLMSEGLTPTIKALLQKAYQIFS